MRIFGYEIKVTRPSDGLAPGPVQRSGGGVPVSDWLRGADYGGSTYSNPFTQVSFVYRAITALAEQVANIPFRFAAIAEGKDRITTGRLHEFYTRPQVLHTHRSGMNPTDRVYYREAEMRRGPGGLTADG
jgi:hypothetical protein